MTNYSDEYALNSFPEIWQKDKMRLLDVGNDAQILYDMATGNKTGETDRAERNILHAMGEPYKPGEIFFNVATNIAPAALAALGGAMQGSKLAKITELTRAYKPYALVPSKWDMTTKQALKMTASTIADTMAKDSAESVGKTLGKAALKGGIKGALTEPPLAAGYALSRPKSYSMSHLKGIILSILNADVEDPARFNETDVHLAYGTLFGKDELNKALDINLPPRDMISNIRAAAKKHPDKMAEYRAKFIKAKAAYNTKKEEQ